MNKNIKEIDETKLKIVFIIPYRDRQEHKFFFEKYMNYILEDYKKDEYFILFSKQENDLPFNRGGMKNLGFLFIKKMFPKIYSKLTFVFHDIDCVPYKKELIDYKTNKGVIKHFYGYKFALGGIFSINGHDFEIIDGFPNFWGWGFEDNMIYNRAVKYNIKVDRSVFFNITSHKILHFYDGIKKNVTKNQVYSQKFKKYKETDGIKTIRNLSQKWNDSENMLHNISFEASYKPDSEFFVYDLLKYGNKMPTKNIRNKNYYDFIY